MATLSTSHTYHPLPKGRFTGLMFVIGLHCLLLYGLMAGMKRNAVPSVKPPPLTISLAQTDLPDPLTPPAAPAQPITHQNKQSRPEVTPTQMAPSDVVSDAVTNSPVEIPISAVPTSADPPMAQGVVQPPAAVASPIGVACHYMVAPEMPRKAIIENASGVVRATVLIRDGAVADITQITGPRIFYAAVKSAMMQYRCHTSAGDVTATQEFNFKLIE